MLRLIWIAEKQRYSILRVASGIDWIEEGTRSDHLTIKNQGWRMFASWPAKFGAENTNSWTEFAG